MVAKWSASAIVELTMTRRLDTYELRKHAYDDFDRTIEQLNETMGLCIK